jgi:hypothetical protein
MLSVGGAAAGRNFQGANVTPETSSELRYSGVAPYVRLRVGRFFLLVGLVHQQSSEAAGTSLGKVFITGVNKMAVRVHEVVQQVTRTLELATPRSTIILIRLFFREM